MPRNCGRFTAGSRPLAEGARVKRGKEFLAGQRADDVNFQLGRFACRQTIQRAGNGAWYAGAHEYVIHVGEHRAIKRGQGGQLDFFEKINTDQSAVAFLGQKHFHEVGHHRQFDERRAGAERGHGSDFEWRGRRFSAGNEVLRQHARGDFGNRKLLHSTAQVAFGIAHLKGARENDGQSGSGNNAQLPQFGNGARQSPAGHGYAHPALNNLRL